VDDWVGGELLTLLMCASSVNWRSFPASDDDTPTSTTLRLSDVTGSSQAGVRECWLYDIICRQPISRSRLFENYHDSKSATVYNIPVVVKV